MSSSSEPVLLLGWREFGVNVSTGELNVNGQPILIQEVGNSGEGTGHVVWDGSIVLAKFIERRLSQIQGARVLELGAGTGLIGIACAASGAKQVYVTDLPYCLANMQHNIELNKVTDRVEAFALDWSEDCPADSRLENLDLIVAADVIWIPELVVPFVSTCRALAERNPGLKGIFFAHQTRALKTDQLLFSTLREQGFQVTEFAKEEMHPEFISQRINLFMLALID